MERPAPITELFRLAKSKPAHLCAVHGCRCRRAGDGGRLCNGHKQQAWRLRNPTRAAYATLRDHARGRGLEFSLSWEFFAALSAATGYAAGRGSAPDALAVDRLDFRQGYTEQNVRIVPVSENGAKGAVEAKLSAMGWPSPWAAAGAAALPPEAVNGTEADEENCPF